MKTILSKLWHARSNDMLKMGAFISEIMSKKIDPEIEKNYEEMVEEDTEYGENKNYTKIEEECNSRRVWCDYCVKSISPPQYFVNKICCSYCGKVLLEDNFHLMARQVCLNLMQININLFSNPC
ncbi:uncharacterized protein LOC129877070 isoform X3 [Solanum dulcamara]|uniref:uncharacterized protein LOC129877070 isoform X3 n=1 Tax=Solanum dulcamara TaxID=45834 RepID=UPI0024864784|nr:uncharacterized protein LOC129877070 isoform X3 [Solanum dulcamara]